MSWDPLTRGKVEMMKAHINRAKKMLKTEFELSCGLTAEDQTVEIEAGGKL